MIRKIHQIWVQGANHFEEKQPDFFSFSKKWPILFPECEYKLWSEEQYLPLIEDYSASLLAAYQRAPNFACKSDIARYVILHKYGGLYADTDYEPFKNAEYLMQDMDLVVVAMHLSKNKRLFGDFKYNTAWIYATPGHTLFQTMLTKIEHTPFDAKQFRPFDYIWTITGPKAFGNAIEDLNLVQDLHVRILDHPTVEVADFSTVAITKYNQEEVLLQFPYAIGIHRCDGSWINNIRTVKQIFGEFYTWLTEWSDFVHIALVVLLIICPIIFLILWKTRCNKHKCSH